MSNQKDSAASEGVPDRIWIPTSAATLMEVSPELQNVEGAWYVREPVTVDEASLADAYELLADAYTAWFNSVEASTLFDAFVAGANHSRVDEAAVHRAATKVVDADWVFIDEDGPSRVGAIQRVAEIISTELASDSGKVKK